jgi:hypothetical protein
MRAEESGEEPVDGLPGRPRLHRLKRTRDQDYPWHITWSTSGSSSSIPSCVIFSELFFAALLSSLFENFCLPFSLVLVLHAHLRSSY